ncbi:uncharacterized protein LOC126681518 [Mercurialis annua]|uniref:uncharacterized protein LOC126681518 n=1 Tax=Mercurialis annua TaxID=3986 RepID=UPI00215F3E13|nr:uncharacterized protein LOC126681518 [Mercurialis annua]
MSTARNDVVFNKIHSTASSIIDKACEQQREYLEVSGKKHIREGMPNTLLSVETDLALWSPPPTGFHKVNFDGAIDMNLKIGAVGFVVSDIAGNIIFVGARRFIGMVIPLIIEALALRTSMEEVLSTGLTVVIFEGDCQVLINAINASSSNDRDVGVVLEDIFNLVSRFSEIRFQYVNHKCNWVAHLVAKRALIDDCFCRSHHFVMEWLTQVC